MPCQPMKLSKYLFLIVMLTFVGCGGVGDFLDSSVPSQTDPIITRIAPTAARAGDVVTIFGIGFSAAAPLNIIVIGSVEVAADSYTLLAAPTGSEVESITFTVPAGLTVGFSSIYVVVIDNPSNENLTITINP